MSHYQHVYKVAVLQLFSLFYPPSQQIQRKRKKQLLKSFCCVCVFACFNGRKKETKRERKKEREKKVAFCLN